MFYNHNIELAQEGRETIVVTAKTAILCLHCIFKVSSIEIEASSTTLQCSSFNFADQTGKRHKYSMVQYMFDGPELKSNHMGILNKTDQFFEHQQLPRST